MNEIRIFDYQSNEVRTVEMNGEPWFVLKDVCEVLGLASPHNPCMGGIAADAGRLYLLRSRLYSSGLWCGSQAAGA